MARGWLHFIDREDYYVTKFVKEAQGVGVALTISLPALQKMEWGDRIALLQVGGAPSIKSAVMFAEFPVRYITGLSAPVVDALAGRFQCMLVDMGGEKLRRGGTDHHTGFSYDIDAPLGAVAEALAEIYADISAAVPMIACMPDQIKPVDKPLPMFRDIIYRTGYAPFDIEDVNDRIQGQRSFNPMRRPRIPGQFYDPDDPQRRAYCPGVVATVLEEFPGTIQSVSIFAAP